MAGGARAQNSDTFDGNTAGANLTGSVSAAGGSWANLNIGAHTGAFVFTGSPSGMVRDNNVNGAVDTAYVFNPTSAPSSADRYWQSDITIQSTPTQFGKICRAVGAGTNTFYWFYYEVRQQQNPHRP